MRVKAGKMGGAIAAGGPALLHGLRAKPKLRILMIHKRVPSLKVGMRRVLRMTWAPAGLRLSMRIRRAFRGSSKG